MGRHKIEKVLNSSVVLVKDEPDKEFIILQKGIGYGKRPGQWVEADPGSQIFVPYSQTDGAQLIELLGEIPPEYLKVSQEIVEYAQKQLDTTLNQHIYVTLLDHLYYAVERLHQNIAITNRVLWELKTFYPKEYQIGLHSLELVKHTIGESLPEEEAGNIAFHIVNASKETDSGYDAMRAAKLIGIINEVVTYTMNAKPDKESVHYSRYISHLQFFAERFFSGKMLESDDDFLYHQMESGYPKALSCAERIRTYLIREYDTMISNEEVAYLTVHIQRLISR